jgi:hypothetical protein
MAESVAELLGRLRFVGGPVETLYLNQTRVRESFIGQLGAIESFTRNATKELKGETPVVKIGGGLASGADVTWTLGDPITQVLVLRAALESEEALCGLDDAAPGRYIRFTGAGCVSRPGMFDDMHQERLREHLDPDLYKALEAERATEENILRMTEGQDRPQWLLTVSEGPSVCASIIDARALTSALRHWMSPDSRWDIFALFNRRHETGVPLWVTLHVGVDFVK